MIEQYVPVWWDADRANASGNEKGLLTQARSPGFSFSEPEGVSPPRRLRFEPSIASLCHRPTDP